MAHWLIRSWINFTRLYVFPESGSLAHTYYRHTMNVACLFPDSGSLAHLVMNKFHKAICFPQTVAHWLTLTTDTPWMYHVFSYPVAHWLIRSWIIFTRLHVFPEEEISPYWSSVVLSSKQQLCGATSQHSMLGICHFPQWFLQFAVVVFVFRAHILPPLAATHGVSIVSVSQWATLWEKHVALWKLFKAEWATVWENI